MLSLFLCTCLHCARSVKSLLLKLVNFFIRLTSKTKAYQGHQYLKSLYLKMWSCQLFLFHFQFMPMESTNQLEIKIDNLFILVTYKTKAFQGHYIKSGYLNTWSCQLFLFHFYFMPMESTNQQEFKLDNFFILVTYKTKAFQGHYFKSGYLNIWFCQLFLFQFYFMPTHSTNQQDFKLDHFFIMVTYNTKTRIQLYVSS